MNIEVKIRGCLKSEIEATFALAILVSALKTKKYAIIASAQELFPTRKAIVLEVGTFVAVFNGAFRLERENFI